MVFHVNFQKLLYKTSVKKCLLILHGLNNVNKKKIFFRTIKIFQYTIEMFHSMQLCFLEYELEAATRGVL